MRGVPAEISPRRGAPASSAGPPRRFPRATFCHARSAGHSSAARRRRLAPSLPAITARCHRPGRADDRGRTAAGRHAEVRACCTPDGRGPPIVSPGFNAASRGLMGNRASWATGSHGRAARLANGRRMPAALTAVSPTGATFPTGATGCGRFPHDEPFLP